MEKHQYKWRGGVGSGDAQTLYNILNFTRNKDYENASKYYKGFTKESMCDNDKEESPMKGKVSSKMKSQRWGSSKSTLLEGNPAHNKPYQGEF